MPMIDFELLRVTEMKHLRDRVLWLRFSDGVEGTVDLAGRLHGPMFDPLEAPEVFVQAGLADAYTVAWPNGADLAPEFLYRHLEVSGNRAEPKRSDGQLFDADAAREAAQCAGMPEISRFFGIVIRMFYDDHAAPHFHAQYGEYLASIDIRDGMATSRRFPIRALRLIADWRELHHEELLANWERLRRGEAPAQIPPLD